MIGRPPGSLGMDHRAGGTAANEAGAGVQGYPPPHGWRHPLRVSDEAQDEDRLPEVTMSGVANGESTGRSRSGSGGDPTIARGSIQGPEMALSRGSAILAKLF